MVGKAACIGVLFADLLARVGHQQAIQDVRCFVHRGWDGLGGEGAELVGDMSIGFQSGFVAILGVDEVHRLALARGREELPVTGRGDAATPEPGHRQGGLTLTKTQVRMAQAAMASRDTSVSELCKELGVKPVTLYRYVDPNGNLRDYGKRVLSA